MTSRLALIALLPALLPASAMAAETYTLTPAQVEAAMRSGVAARSTETAQTVERPSRRIHGEVGAMIGTGGTRGLFGTVLAPIGDSGFASIQFEDSRYGNTRRWRPQNVRQAR